MRPVWILLRLQYWLSPWPCFGDWKTTTDGAIRKLPRRKGIVLGPSLDNLRQVCLHVFIRPNNITQMP